MDLLLNRDQEDIVASVRAFLSAELPLERLRAGFAAPSNIDRGLWSSYAALGWFGLGLPDEAGGVGYGLAEEALLFREIGRQLVPGPLLSTVLGARTAAAAGNADVTSAILDGTVSVGLGHPRDGGEVGALVTAELDLFDSAGADLILVASPGAVALVNHEALVAVEHVPCLDPASRVGRARAEQVSATAFLSATTDPIFERGAVLAAATASGIAEAARDMAADHARTRVQFGKPIGVNQAVKHSCTDMAVRAEAAASLTFMAAMTLDRSLPDAALQVASAKVVATDAARRNSRANIQVHGGMGFTWEHGAHLLLKRTHMIAAMFGDRWHHLRTLISLPAVPR